MAKSGIVFKKDSQGFINLMNSSACQAMLLGKAQAIASGSESRSTYKDSDFVADVRPGRNRAHARAKSASRGAYWAALKQHVMTASIGDAR